MTTLHGVFKSHVNDILSNVYYFQNYILRLQSVVKSLIEVVVKLFLTDCYIIYDENV